MEFTTAADLARDLASRAEAVCRHYLPSGRRQGRYWIVGNINGMPGQSLFVRLTGSTYGKGAAGKWQDAATGQHGDLLDLIRFRCGFARFIDAADEGRRFLGLAPSPPPKSRAMVAKAERPRDAALTVRAARRLFAGAHAIGATLAATYLAHRGLTAAHDARWLRFHPCCFYCAEADSQGQTWPAMLAAITDLSGTVVGVHRTFLARDGLGKAPLPSPRRALGQLRGHAVRFGTAHDIMTAGEGVETVLSVVNVLPALPAIAALSAANLAAVAFPSTLRRIYIAQDNDPAGRTAVAALFALAQGAGIEPIILVPVLGDFNDDLRILGPDALGIALRMQLAPEDVSRVMPVA